MRDLARSSLVCLNDAFTDTHFHFISKLSASYSRRLGQRKHRAMHRLSRSVVEVCRGHIYPMRFAPLTYGVWLAAQIMNNLSEVQLAGPSGPTPPAREAAQAWARHALETARRALVDAPREVRVNLDLSSPQPTHAPPGLPQTRSRKSWLPRWLSGDDEREKEEEGPVTCQETVVAALFNLGSLLEVCSFRCLPCDQLFFAHAQLK